MQRQSLSYRLSMLARFWSLSPFRMPPLRLLSISSFTVYARTLTMKTIVGCIPNFRPLSLNLGIIRISRNKVLMTLTVMLVSMPSAVDHASIMMPALATRPSILSSSVDAFFAKLWTDADDAMSRCIICDRHKSVNRSWFFPGSLPE